MSCDHNCQNCKLKGNCNDENKYFSLNQSKIKHIIGIMSGKGGVGKSTVTCLLASLMKKNGYKVGILDADITGPSIPMAFGVHQRLKGSNKELEPAISKDGIKMVSLNLLLDNENDPIVWRGPILGSAVKQFYCETKWDELDYLFIDMPPGTSDIQLTVLNNIKLDGVIIVSSPQDLVKMVVSKCANLVTKVGVNIIGIVENMAFVKCPCCNNKIMLYGNSRLNEISKELQTNPLASLPIDPTLNELMDKGKVYEYESNELDYVLNILNNL